MSFPLLFLFIFCGYSIGICRTFLREESFFATWKQSISKPTLDCNLVARVHHFSTVMASSSNSKLHILCSKYTTSKRCLIYDIINILNYSNCFVNSVVYSLRTPEFRQALVLCLTRCQKVINRPGGYEGRGNRRFALTPLPSNSRPLQQDFELKPVDTKL